MSLRLSTASLGHDSMLKLRVRQSWNIFIRIMTTDCISFHSSQDQDKVELRLNQNWLWLNHLIYTTYGCRQNDWWEWIKCHNNTHQQQPLDLLQNAMWWVIRFFLTVKLEFQRIFATPGPVSFRKIMQVFSSRK